MTSLILAFLFQSTVSQAAVPQLLIAPQPIAPPEAVETVIVALEGTINRDGRLINSRVLQGLSAFIQPSLQAVRRWEFGPQEALERERQITATFLYRARGIIAERPFPLRLAVPETGNGDRPAVPLTIIDPGYPPNAIGQGAVILQVNVTPTGTVDRVDVVRAEPSLTEAAADAVRRWRFEPAYRGGAAVPGTAIVVISFQLPVLSRR
jgi:TonB family protein